MIGCRALGLKKSWRLTVQKHPIDALPQTQSPGTIADTGKVRLGGMSPALPPIRCTPAVSDSGKVRLGGMSPSLPPVRPQSGVVEDSGRVRLGGMSPSLPPARSIPKKIE